MSGKSRPQSSHAAPPVDLALLLNALRALKAQSDDGFEGFFRDLLQSISGRTFRLMKSGPQGGKDLLTESDLLSPGIAIEAKRFRAKTNLSLDALKFKLREAIETTPALDLWGLVVSQEMREPDWSELKEIAAEHGVTLLCLDWQTAPGSLPTIATLCAAARHISENRLTGDLSTLFDSIESHPDFSSAVDRIRTWLIAPETGFDLARTAARAWLAEATSDESLSRQRLRNRATAIHCAKAHFIPRPAIARGMDDWWKQKQKSPAVLLGHEGRGKSWAALSWCIERFEDSNPPLVLAVSAKDIAAYADAGEMLAGLLSRCMPTARTDSLARRVKRWVQAGNETNILLLVDGLNERWDHPWHEFIGLFETEPWKGRVSILLTCRQGFWRDQLLCLAGTTDKSIDEIPVPDFGNQELDNLLQCHGLSRDELQRGLLDLIRIPRFAMLAISMRERLQDTGDLTIARLVLEDWRSRLEERAAELKLDDEGLLAFVAGLGRDILDDENFSISVKEIHGRISSDSGQGLEHYRNAISEITEGLWLEPSGKPHRFKVSQRLLPYVIGLDLARVVESLEDEAGIEEAIAKFEEQLQGADIGVAILRAATSIAFGRGRTTLEARRGLLKKWLGYHNFNDVDFAEMWPLIVLDPPFFCEFAEAHWADQPVTRREGEFLVKGLANATKWPQVLDELVARFPRWAGAFGFDPARWVHRASVPEDETLSAETTSRLDAWNAVQQNYHFPVTDYLRPDAQDHLGGAALSIISFIARAPFIETIVTWAIAHALMADCTKTEALDWLLRHNIEDHDEAEMAILAEVSQLQGLSNVVADRAAKSLVDALATSRVLQEQISSPEVEAHWSAQRFPGWPFLQEDGGIVWPPATPDVELEAITWTERLATFAPFPNSVLSQDDLAIVTDAVKSIRDSSEPLTCLANHDRVMLTFARWLPTALGELLRRSFSDPYDGERSGACSAHELGPALLVLGDHERRRLVAHGLKKLASLVPAKEDSEKAAVSNCQNFIVAGLAEVSSSDQIDILEKLLPVFAFSVDLALFLAPPAERDLRRVFDLIGNATNGQIRQSWLNYLEHMKLEKLPSNASILLKLAQSDDKPIRTSAIKILAQAEDEELGRRFADDDWSYKPGQERAEAIFGTYLLSHHGAHIAFDELRGRVMPEALAYLVEQRGCRESEVRAVFDYIDGLLDGHINRTLGSHTVYGNRYRTDGVWRRIVRMDDSALIKKLKRAARERPLYGFFSVIPLNALLRAIFHEAPADGVEIWMRANKEHLHAGMRVADFNHLPFESFDSDELAQLRTYRLDHSINDQDLCEVAFLALRGGHEDWLITLIKNDLQSANAGKIARALTLAGFLDATPKSQELWNEIIEPLSLSVWLEGVRCAARATCESNKNARHWFEEYLSTEDADEAFGLLRLFHEAMDNRMALWTSAIINSHRDDIAEAWLQHIDATSQLRKNKLKKVEERRKKVLYHTHTLPYLAPWL